MATKIYDIAVETGRYTDNNGKDKKLCGEGTA